MTTTRFVKASSSLGHFSTNSDLLAIINTPRVRSQRSNEAPDSIWPCEMGWDGDETRTDTDGLSLEEDDESSEKKSGGGRDGSPLESAADKVLNLFLRFSPYFLLL